MYQPMFRTQPDEQVLFNPDTVKTGLTTLSQRIAHVASVLEDVRSLHHAGKLTRFLALQAGITGVRSYYFPHLQQLVLTCFVITPLKVDAVTRVHGHFGPEALRFAPQE